MEARKAIDRAKGRLMDVIAMSESDAYSHIQHQAMSERRPMAEVAAEIVEMGEDQLKALSGKGSDA